MFGIVLLSSKVENRWGSISGSITLIAGLEHALRAGWIIKKFGKSGKRQEDLINQHLDVQAVDQALTSDFWWSYLGMATIVAEGLLQLMFWAESCPCR